MSLQVKINEDLKQAMKNKKEPDLSTLRMLKSDLQYELTKTGASTLDDNTVLQIIKKNISKRKDTAEEYRKAGRNDLAEKEESEAKFLESYLPPSVPEAEIQVLADKIIAELGAKSASDVGKVMGRIMAELKGKNVEGALVSKIVKSKLS
ncbi:MAG: GatB/YqeY domain-containing protein [Leptospiraceae bacterium]|nr:GatB/YqeY domain-containing protein [Leptospiraceae bacterium]